VALSPTMTKRAAACLLFPLLLLGGCGGSGTAATSGSSAASAGSSGAETGSALAPDARSAATGDIPDTQNFLTLSAVKLKASMLYPEGWTVRETGSTATVQDKNNLVRISTSRGAAPSPASVQRELSALARATPGLAAGAPRALRLPSGPAVMATYRTQSAPNPVTAKRVTLSVDRYVLAHAGRVAVVELGTPVGVDNVDAYKRMIESFKWL
jgi:hypothetical protein